MHDVLDFVFHLDTHLAAFVAHYGFWVYALLFAIVFAETGLVVTPFLPGDSLLFTCGALAAGEKAILDIWVVAPLLILAAILGDTTNYAVGHFVGPRIFRADDERGIWHRLMNRRHLMQAHAFFERHGGKAVVLGQFMPIIRTFVPFVAGCGSMTYTKFAFFNLVAALSWVGICMGAGYAFGNIEAVKAHFELVVIGIVVVSLIPAVCGFLSGRIRSRATDADVVAK
jgi:membrane-associated protein